MFGERELLEDGVSLIFFFVGREAGWENLSRHKAVCCSRRCARIKHILLSWALPTKKVEGQGLLLSGSPKLPSTGLDDWSIEHRIIYSGWHSIDQWYSGI